MLLCNQTLSFFSFTTILYTFHQNSSSLWGVQLFFTLFVIAFPISKLFNYSAPKHKSSFMESSKFIHEKMKTCLLVLSQVEQLTFMSNWRPKNSLKSHWATFLNFCVIFVIMFMNKKNTSFWWHACPTLCIILICWFKFWF
jgi:hypothetical protein